MARMSLLTATSPAVWDRRAELDVGLFIARYMAENPPPADALFVEVFEEWSRKLVGAGRAGLAELGAAPLRATEGGA